jgi:hypothetical protein
MEEKDLLFPESGQDTNVNENDLDGEWLRQSGLYSYWSRMWARELKLKDKIWLRKKILKAQLYKKHRLLLIVEGKAPSDSRVDNEVHADPEYEKVSIELIDAEERVNALDSIKWAMEQKKKSLEQLCNTRDREYNMPDSYAPKRQAREKRLDEWREKSEELDRQSRATAEGKMKIKR